MSIVAKPNTFSPNTVISSSQVNANFDTLYNDYNGAVSSANLATDSVVTSKIADGAVTAAKIPDGSLSAAKINFGGAGSGIWWQEIGRTTLSSPGDTITVSSLPAKRYLKIIINLIDTGGTINVGLRFNNDSGNTYASRVSSNGASDGTQTSASSISCSASTGAYPTFLEFDWINNEIEDKIGIGFGIEAGATGAATTPQRREVWGKWANVSNQISSVTVVNNVVAAATGDYAIGSEVIVLGHD